MPEDLKELEQSIQDAKKADAELSAPDRAQDTNPESKGAGGAVSSDLTKLQSQLAEKDAELSTLRRQIAERNVEFASQIDEMKEREDEFAQALTELKNSNDPPASQLTRSDPSKMDRDEIVGDAQYADYLIFRIAAERRDRQEPGYSKSLFAQVAADEKKSGALAGYRIPGLTV